MNVIHGNLLNADTDYIAHQVNCQGVMGAGLALQIKQHYPDAYRKYRNHCLNLPASKLLGIVHKVGRILNIFGQNRYGYGQRHTDYNALATAFQTINSTFSGSSIAFPYGFGAGLAGGDLQTIHSLMDKYLTDVHVTLYKYK